MSLLDICCCLVATSCPTLCDPVDCSPPDSSVHGILQARILEWVAISFSRDLSNPGIEPYLLHWQADSLPLKHLGSILVHFGAHSRHLTEKAMAPHSLAWEIPWMEEPGRLQSMGSLRVRHDWATSLSLFTFTHWRRKWQPTPVFLPGGSQGQGSLVGCHLMGSHGVGQDWSNLAGAGHLKWISLYSSFTVFIALISSSRHFSWLPQIDRIKIANWVEVETFDIFLFSAWVWKVFCFTNNVWYLPHYSCGYRLLYI